MTALRVYQVTIPAPSTRLRLYQVGLTGTEASTPKLRLYSVSVNGTTVATLLPIPSIVGQEPGRQVEIVLHTAGGVTPDSYSLTRLSGPAVTITGSGPEFTILTPGVHPSDPNRNLVLRATTTLDGHTSPPVDFTISLLPDTVFTRAPGGSWQGGTRL